MNLLVPPGDPNQRKKHPAIPIFIIPPGTPSHKDATSNGGSRQPGEFNKYTANNVPNSVPEEEKEDGDAVVGLQDSDEGGAIHLGKKLSLDHKIPEPGESESVVSGRLWSAYTEEKSGDIDEVPAINIRSNIF